MFNIQIMKKNLLFLLVLTATLALGACSDDDDNNPDPVNEEELITTLRLTIAPEGGGPAVTLESVDIDGDGPGAPEVTVSGNLMPNTSYIGNVLFINETVDPADNVTIEVLEEADEHQVFFIPSSALNITPTYLNFDNNGNPLGTSIALVTGDTSFGTLNVVLRHEPNKPNDGTLADAGGETDIDVSFEVTVQ